MNGEAEQQTLIIEAGKCHSRYLRDLWEYRELFLMLAWRDILVRYKQTVIGILWSVLRPLLGMVVFTLVFGRLAKLPSDGIPYPLIAYSGMLIWQFFSNTVSIGGESLLNNTNLISKVYFPRLIVPTTGMTVSLADFLISAILFIPLFVWYGFLPDWRIVFLPFFLFLTAAFSLGVSYLISAWNVKYRDFRHAVPFAIQLGAYLSPVGFVSGIVPEKWRIWYSLNPLAGMIDGVRWSLFGTKLYLPSLLLSIVLSALFLVAGFLTFRSMERRFADEI